MQVSIDLLIPSKSLCRVRNYILFSSCKLLSETYRLSRVSCFVLTVRMTGYFDIVLLFSCTRVESSCANAVSFKNNSSPRYHYLRTFPRHLFNCLDNEGERLCLRQIAYHLYKQSLLYTVPFYEDSFFRQFVLLYFLTSLQICICCFSFFFFQNVQCLL